MRRALISSLLFFGPILAHAQPVTAPIPKLSPTPTPISPVPSLTMNPALLPLFPASGNMQDASKVSLDWRNGSGAVVTSPDDPITPTQRRCVAGGTLGGDYWRVGVTPGLGSPGSCYMTSLPNQQLRSVNFVPQKRYLTLAIRADGGGQSSVVVDPGGGKPPIASQTVPPGGHWHRIALDLNTAAAAKSPVRLRISTGASVASIDDVSWSDTPPTQVGKLDVPLFGFADLHTHPVANLGFGGGLIAGEVDGLLDKAQKSCVHTGGATPTIIMNNLEPGHNHSGYPLFKDWPKFRSTLHHQLYVDWIKRAWQGGLRLMVALAVNNEALAKYFGQVPSERNDSVIAGKQIQAIQAFASRHSDFVEIAPTPAAARKIIHEGKLAIVLGTEIDFMNDCHQQCDVIAEMQRGACSPTRAARAGDECQAMPNASGLLGACTNTSVTSDIRDLKGKGARHIFLVHHADNDLSGAALYGDSFNIFSTWARGYALWPETAKPSDGIQYALSAANGGIKEGLGGMPTVNCTKYGRNPIAAPGHREYPPGPHVNSRGLSALGEVALTEAWRQGMVVDVDHMSLKAFDRAAALAREKNSAIVAGHTWPRSMKLLPGQTSDTENHNGKLASENDKSTAQMNTIRDLRGIVGVGSGPVDGGQAPGSQVPNDCAGTTRSWVQGYIQTVRDAGRAALGTDMGLQAQLMPRFGSWACVARNKGGAWHVADEPSSRAYAVKSGADGQHFAVAYKTPMTTYYSNRFGFPQGGVKTEPYDFEERAMFQAIVLVQSGVDPLKADYSKADDWGHWPEGAQHFALGMRSNEDNPACGDFNFGCGERRTGFLVSRGRPLGPNEHPRVKQLYPKAKRAWDKFQEIKRGTGTPLERSTAGSREFDFNIDGLAHYGMIPDMLQDAYNQLQNHPGGNVRDLSVMMRSAEDYIRAWEAIEASRR